MSYTDSDFDRIDPLWGATHQQLRDNGMLGGGTTDTSDYGGEGLVFNEEKLSAEFKTLEINPNDINQSIKLSVKKDIDIHDLSYLLQPQNAFDLALDAYSTYAKDTTFDVTHYVENYFHELSEQLPANIDRERFEREIEWFLSELDGEYAKYLDAKAGDEQKPQLISA